MARPHNHWWSIMSKHMSLCHIWGNTVEKNEKKKKSLGYFYGWANVRARAKCLRTFLSWVIRLINQQITIIIGKVNATEGHTAAGSSVASHARQYLKFRNKTYSKLCSSTTEKLQTHCYSSRNTHILLLIWNWEYECCFSWTNHLFMKKLAELFNTTTQHISTAP